LQKLKYLLILVISPVILTFSQEFKIHSYDYTYDAALKMQTSGKISMSKLFYRPIERTTLSSILSDIKSKEEEILLIEKRLTDTSSSINSKFATESTKSLHNYFFDDSPSNLFSFQDDLITIRINPILSQQIVLGNNNSNRLSSLITSYGGKLNFSYSNWLKIDFRAWNGIASGDKSLTLLDEKVRHSYTYNITEIENFDGTEGTLTIGGEHFKLSFGRERLMWGNSNLNRLIFDSTAQVFDYLSLSFEYGIFDYKFLHGWLVEKPDTVIIKRTGLSATYKNPKYIAFSRLGLSPTSSVYFGISQTIIYANRPLEAGYMNPLIFYESVQRSLNDLDNSFLSLDIAWRVIDGAVAYGTLMLDDINFNHWLKGDWATSSNSSLYQFGVRFSDLIFRTNSLVEVEYTVLRPFALSHPGFESALSYTNNGYQMVTGIPPNSSCITISLNTNPYNDVNINLRTDFLKHGNNLYDSEGTLLINYGANPFYSRDLYTPYLAPLHQGIIEYVVNTQLKISYHISYNMLCGINFLSNSLTSQSEKKTFNTITFNINFFR